MRRDKTINARSAQDSRPLSDVSDVADQPEEDGPEISARNPAVSVILLAAGSSSRMGKSKQLLPIAGEPLLLRSATAAIASHAEHVVVVLGANEQPHHEVIRGLPLTVVSNHYWKNGLGSSIKTGMNAMLKRFPETGAVIIMVCDQPAVTPQHLRNLIQRYHHSKSPIVASAYGDTAGVPVLFSRPFFSNILMLRDDQGAKKIIQQFSSKVQTVDLPGGLLDIDTAEDYQKFIDQK